MRILVTVPWPERRGGAEAMLQAVLDGVADSPHEIELVFTQAGSWPRELAAAGMRVQVIEAGRARQLHRSLVTVLRLALLFRRRRPDVILNWATKTQLYGSPAAVLAGMRRRVVWWQHAFPERAWLDRVAQLLPAAAIVCYSEDAARAQARMRPSRPTVVVNAGTDPVATDLQAAEVASSPGVPVVGIVGRLQPWKGQDRLLGAIALLRDRGHDAHLLIVGGDSYGLSPEYAASLPESIEALGLSDRVTMTGEVPDAAPYIARMDVLVNASEREPFGIVVIEGMAAALPIVAVDAGGPGEIVLDGETGMLARSGSSGDLADAIEPLLGSVELRARLGAAGRERFERRYTSAAMRQRFFAALERIVQGEER